MTRRILAGALNIKPADLQVALGEHAEWHVDIPRDAYVVCRIENALVNGFGVSDSLNWRLCQQLQRLSVTLLTNLTVNDLPGLLRQRAAGARMLDTVSLTALLQRDYGIDVGRVITPADAELARSLAKHAGDAYDSWIKPALKMMPEKLDAATVRSFECDTEFRRHERHCSEMVNRFVVRFPTHADADAHILGESMRHFLHEHASCKRSLVYFDSDVKQLTKMYNLGRQEGWDVRCFQVDATTPVATVRRYEPWQELLRKNLCGYVIRRGADPREYKHSIFSVGLGVSKTTKLNAARELLALIEGGEPAVILQETHDDYDDYIAALAQTGRDLLAAIKHDDLPADCIKDDDVATIKGLIDVLHAQSESRRPALQAAHIVV